MCWHRVHCAGPRADRATLRMCAPAASLAARPSAHRKGPAYVPLTSAPCCTHTSAPWGHCRRIAATSSGVGGAGPVHSGFHFMCSHSCAGSTSVSTATPSSRTALSSAASRLKSALVASAAPKTRTGGSLPCVLSPTSPPLAAPAASSGSAPHWPAPWPWSWGGATCGVGFSTCLSQQSPSSQSILCPLSLRWPLTSSSFVISTHVFRFTARRVAYFSQLYQMFVPEMQTTVCLVVLP
mmetsp:Transcript_2249/g.6493  ORF Transcript_2249/g.6493 Transcript_2249/m.6493 type:complete len:238 (+) Transcript_2249:159-872(+)